MARPIKMSDDAGRSEQNPALFRHPSGEVWLLYTAQEKTDQGTALVRIRRSSDGGLTWSETRDLFTQAGTFIRHPPVVNPSGLLLLPVWRSNIRNAFGDDPSLVQVSRMAARPGRSSTYRTAAAASTWTSSRTAASPFSDGAGLMPCSAAPPNDDGLTWTAPQPTTLPNNNSSIQARELKDDRIAIVYNENRSTGGAGESSVPPWVRDKEAFLARCEATDSSAIWGVPRNPLVIAISTDLGLTWRKELVLEADAGLRSAHDEKGAFVGDYSYPSIIQTRDGQVQVSYSYLRDYIKHLTLEA